ncbi:MAG: imidazolonepropionase [Pseudobdellovibrionaceae bacterium]
MKKALTKAPTKTKGFVFRNIDSLLSLEGASLKQGRQIQEADLSIVKKAAMVVQDGKIVWVGPQKSIPRIHSKNCFEVDLHGMTVIPGLVECHTHSLFAGSRSQEFEMRLQGISYQEIAKKGGGILSTMRETRKATALKLKELTQSRVDRFVAQGVTTLEIKTGYALDEKNEIKSLKTIRSLQGPRVVPTFLGAHSVPPEFSSAKDYLEHLETILPEIRKLTDRLDIWIEKGFFEKEFSRKYLEKAKELGFQILVHADQLTLSGGTELAVELQAISADHVIQLQDREIQILAKSTTTAVLLPMADLYMKCTYPPARQLIDSGARVALATDFNPGSCPSQDLALVGLLARLEMKMSLPEVIAAYTVGASHALNLEDETGSLESGKSADFACIDDDWTKLFYAAGDLPVRKSFLKGRLILDSENN